MPISAAALLNTDDRPVLSYSTYGSALHRTIAANLLGLLEAQVDPRGVHVRGWQRRAPPTAATGLASREALLGHIQFHLGSAAGALRHYVDAAGLLPDDAALHALVVEAYTDCCGKNCRTDWKSVLQGSLLSKTLLYCPRGMTWAGAGITSAPGGGNTLSSSAANREPRWAGLISHATRGDRDACGNTRARPERGEVDEGVLFPASHRPGMNLTAFNSLIHIVAECVQILVAFAAAIASSRSRASAARARTMTCGSIFDVDCNSASKRLVGVVRAWP